MPLRLFALCLPLALAAACDGDDHHGQGEIIRLDDASDEVVLTLREAYESGEAVVDDEVAARLTAPADGAELPAGSPATFTWTPAQSTLRHGRTTGDFVWLDITCSGMDHPIDVVAIESTSWQADAASWGHMAEAGSCEVLVVSAYVDRGIITEGPYVPSENPTFTVAE
ncbi:MAG TPA: hypothetical protein VKZ63_09470 [Kofleriaceae bacterium]|nr:hypothetical protein [Kofleriaceae bacterium]